MTARRWVVSGIKIVSPNLERSRQLKYNALLQVSPNAVTVRLGLHFEDIEICYRVKAV